MANNPLPYDATVIASVSAVTALANSGSLRIYTGAQPALNGAITGTLLATLPMSATAFGTPTASAGTVTATANAITSASAGNTGTAGYFAILKSDASTIVLTGSVGTSGADLNLSSTSISSGATVSCSSFTITQAEGLTVRRHVRGVLFAWTSCVAVAAGVALELNGRWPAAYGALSAALILMACSSYQHRKDAREVHARPACPFPGCTSTDPAHVHRPPR